MNTIEMNIIGATIFKAKYIVWCSILWIARCMKLKHLVAFSDIQWHSVAYNDIEWRSVAFSGVHLQMDNKMMETYNFGSYENDKTDSLIHRSNLKNRLRIHKVLSPYKMVKCS